MPFRFKQFSVEDNLSTMKVGTDAVVLGAWVNINNSKSILDIGTGCGVIALMMAQRSNAVVDAVEPDKNSADQASDNFKSSPWTDRLTVHNLTVQEYSPTHQYDLIVSNPPFFSNSLLPPTEQRKNARHTTTLSFNDLFGSVRRLLAPEGRFAVIIPSDNTEIFTMATNAGFEVCRKAAVFPRQKLERYLVEFSLRGINQITLKEETIHLTVDGQKRTGEYSDLTKDFYL